MASSSGASRPRGLKVTTEPSKTEMDAGDENTKPNKRSPADLSDEDVPVVVQKPKAKAKLATDDAHPKGKGKGAVPTKRKR